jgi:hypothetical protein
MQKVGVVGGEEEDIPCIKYVDPHTFWQDLPTTRNVTVMHIQTTSSA